MDVTRERISRILKLRKILPSFQTGFSLVNAAVATSETRLMRSLVTSISVYACESWTLTAELQRRIQAIEMRCYRKILHISYKDHVTKKEVRAMIQQATGPHEDLLTIVKRRNRSGVAMSPVHQAWLKPSCKAQ